MRAAIRAGPKVADARRERTARRRRARRDQQSWTDAAASGSSATWRRQGSYVGHVARCVRSLQQDLQVEWSGRSCLRSSTTWHLGDVLPRELVRSLMGNFGHATGKKDNYVSLHEALASQKNYSVSRFCVSQDASSCKFCKLWIECDAYSHMALRITRSCLKYHNLGRYLRFILAHYRQPRTIRQVFNEIIESAVFVTLFNLGNNESWHFLLLSSICA